MHRFFYAISFVGILSIAEQKLARSSEALLIIYDLKLWFAEDLFLHYEDSFIRYDDTLIHYKDMFLHYEGSFRRYEDLFIHYEVVFRPRKTSS